MNNKLFENSKGEDIIDNPDNSQKELRIKVLNMRKGQLLELIENSRSSIDNIVEKFGDSDNFSRWQEVISGHEKSIEEYQKELERVNEDMSNI